MNYISRIGKGTRLRFQNDPKEYYSIFITSSKKTIQVEDNVGKKYYKPLSKITKIDNLIIKEIVIKNPQRTVWDFTKYIPNFDWTEIKVGDDLDILDRDGKNWRFQVTDAQIDLGRFKTNKNVDFSFDHLERYNDENKLKEVNELQKIAGIEEIKINNPNTHFKWLETIDQDGDNIWGMYILKNGPQIPLYVNFPLDGNNISISIEVTDGNREDDIPEINKIKSYLDKYNIPHQEENSNEYWETWIPRKYFEEPK